MILRGILGESLGNFVCVRGFVKLGDIERVSFSDQPFQRPMSQEHVADMVAIKLRQLRIDDHNEGHSYQISDKILSLIEDSGLLIADLTHPNTNVYHEVGFLMGVNKGKQLKQENFILVMRNKSDADNDKRVGFNLRGWQQIRFTETDELKDKIRDSILKYYQFR